MISATPFAGQKVAIFGMGMSGLAAARSLVAAGAQVVAWDDGEAGREAARSAGILVSDLRGEDWREFVALILAPGVPLTHPEPHWTVELARQANVEIIGDTEIFCRARRESPAWTRFVAITGTNGKSTTTALTNHLLSHAGLQTEAGGNIGKAVLDLTQFENGRHYVIEFSSFQIDLTPSLDADVAVLLNISPDHLDRHGTFENYCSVKAKVFSCLPENGVAIVGVDDPFSRAIAESVRSRGKKVCAISAAHRLDTGIFYRDGLLIEAKGGDHRRTVSLEGIPSLRGAHNGQNAAAAAAICLSLGLDWGLIESGLRTFPGLPHRMEEVGRLGRVLFINDSKATNANAASKALSSFSDIYWIVGGRPKSDGLSGLDPWFGRVRKAYLIGEAAPTFAVALEGKVATVHAGTVENAVAMAARDALADVTSAEPVVLLSPACASYDQFPHFVARGECFREAVSSLTGVALRGAQAA